jgi:hypothetical protein
MAYFPNGATMERFQEQFCEKCVHYPGNDEPECCPVWLLHACWHNDAHNGGDPKATLYEQTTHRALETFIPRNPDGSNGECRMFVPLCNSPK